MVGSSRKLAYGIHTMYLFTKSDHPTILFPIMLFAWCSSRNASYTSLLNAGIWTYMHLLQFCISSQVLSPEEDAVNKPWRPIPARRITLARASVLRWTLLISCLLLSICYGVAKPGAIFAVGILLHNELKLDAHWLSRNVLVALAYAVLDAGATCIAQLGRPETVSSSTIRAHYLSIAIVLTTVHAQDFRDEVGDRIAQRLTIPIVMPEIGRYQIESRVLSLALVCLGIVVGMRFYSLRIASSDHTSYVLYCTIEGALGALCNSSTPKSHREGGKYVMSDVNSALVPEFSTFSLISAATTGLFNQTGDNNRVWHSVLVPGNLCNPSLLALGMICLSVTLLAIVYKDRYIGTRPLHGIPGPRGYPIVGNFLQVIPWHGQSLEWLKYMSDTYGSLCTFTLPIYGRGILVKHPEWIAHVRQHDMVRYAHGPNEIALMSEFPGSRVPIASVGTEWRLSRKAIHPIFTTKAFSDHVIHAINQVIPITRELLRDASMKGKAIDWNDLAGRMTLKIFTLSSMALDTGSLQSTSECLTVPDTVCEAIAELNQISSSRLFNPFWKITELFTGERVRFNRARAHVQNLVDDIIQTRKIQLTEHPDDFTHDWLSRLLKDAAFDDSTLLRDILVVFMFAGSDNTRNAFAWSLYSLANSPVWLTRMREEAAKNQRDGGTVAYGDLRLFPVHQAVFFETIRMWPGIPKNGRIALCDDVLPALPVQGLPALEIKKNDFIFWSDYHTMRDETVWGPDADTFNPGRHLDANGNFIRPTAPHFIGFGGPGPRLCSPAMQLVTYEFVACWAGIVPYFDFECLTYDSETGRKVEAPRVAEAFTPAMAGPLMVKVKQRTGGQAKTIWPDPSTGTTQMCNPVDYHAGWYNLAEHDLGLKIGVVEFPTATYDMARV
ncbi:hypothetical protein ONZ51_g5633 [Trametes cubensis]|uniref:Cytochrome P450 n=1 Tax=Trametes cubensis TaxID=1111947 RepID=A0AAD7TU16_9APHY|nr:hypothetical protein ONZ51_g5633 [Trametes cubensis]